MNGEPDVKAEGSLQASVTTPKDDVNGWHATLHAIGISYSGPLPPPEVLREYEQTLAGSAERIFAQFEAEGKHRRANEMKVVESNAFSQRLGTVSASVIGIAGVAGGIWLASRGLGFAGLGTVFMALASIVATFLYQRNSQDHEVSYEPEDSAKKIR